jgi:hypothetical protein
MTIKPSLLVADDEVEIGKIIKAVAENSVNQASC